MQASRPAGPCGSRVYQVHFVSTGRLEDFDQTMKINPAEQAGYFLRRRQQVLPAVLYQ